MVNTKSAPEANGSQEDLMRSRSKLSKVLVRSEGPRHAPEQQGLSHLGLQHADFQTMRGGRPIIQAWAEPFGACPQKMDPSVNFEREVSVFAHNAA